MICDFCSSPHVAFAFQANGFILEPFAAEGITPASEGAWAACPECAAFVAEHNWHGLAKHAAARFVKLYPQIPATVKDLTDEFYVLYAGLLDGQLTGAVQQTSNVEVN